MTGKEKTLPIIYWIPKMHKNPTGARFIIACEICSTKQFSKFLSNFKKFCVLQTSDAINIKTLAKSIAVYDFSTLYTKRSHDHLKSKLSFMVDFALKRGDKTFIRLSNNGAAYWGRKKGDLVLVKHNLEQL